MIPLDLAVQGTAGDPECSRRLCQISVRALQRPFDCEVLEVAETCALGHGRCGCIPGCCCGRCLEILCRQLFDCNLGGCTRQHETLDHIPQFANVAGPAIRLPQRHYFGAEVLFRYSVSLRQLVIEALCQQFDVGVALA